MLQERERKVQLREVNAGKWENPISIMLENVTQRERRAAEICRREADMERMQQEVPAEHMRFMWSITGRCAQLRQMLVRTLGLHRDSPPAHSVEIVSRYLHLGLLSLDQMRENHGLMGNQHIASFVERCTADPADLRIPKTMSEHLLANRHLRATEEHLRSRLPPVSRVPSAPRPRASDLEDLPRMFRPETAQETETESMDHEALGAEPPVPVPPVVPPYHFEPMPANLAKRQITEMKYPEEAGSVDEILRAVWKPDGLRGLCAEIDDVAALGYQEGGSTDGDPCTVLIANVNRKVTRGSLQQKLKVGVHVPSVRIVPDTCTKKLTGCPNPRKRIWADILGNAPDRCKYCRCA